MATPCVTTSRARRTHAVEGNLPRTLRSNNHPRGLPNLRKEDEWKVLKANTLIDHAGQILQQARMLGIPCGEEFPHTSFLWIFRSRTNLFKRWAAPYIDFCSSQGRIRKRTRLVFVHCGDPAVQHMQCSLRNDRCKFTGLPHLQLKGATKGRWNSKTHEPYPWNVATVIGSTLEHAFHRIAVANLASTLR